jgi:hypothetical protein
MAKFNTINLRKIDPVAALSTTTAPAVTHEGAPAFAYDTKSELFTLAVANFVGEDTFYEKASERDVRFAELVRTVAVQDPSWLVSFVTWLRRSANMRSASLVAAAEGVDARLEGEQHGWNRDLVTAALQRADEPGEFVAYWRANFGGALPKPVKRGVGDALTTLVNEYAAMKYDTASRGYRLGDVIELVRPKPKAPWQSALFEYLIAHRHDRERQLTAENRLLLPMVAARKAFGEIDPSTRRALLGTDELTAMMRAGGLTWEALSGWLDGPMNAAAWESVIPQMGLMALARNLRNFDEAGVSDAAAQTVMAKFMDPYLIGKARMFPYRWVAAYENAPSLRWGHALDVALQTSVKAIPEFPGRTLVLVDTSASMTNTAFSKRSKMTPAKAAAIFGTAIAHRNQGRVDLAGFADGTFLHQVRAGGSLIEEVRRFSARTGEVGHGTQISRSVQTLYQGHDRVFIISDMQTMKDPGYGYSLRGDTTSSVPDNVPVYGFDLAGYGSTVIPAGQQRRRYMFGGLTDAMFTMIPLLEQGVAQAWPWK